MDQRLLVELLLDSPDVCILGFDLVGELNNRSRYFLLFLLLLRFGLDQLRLLLQDLA